MILPFRLRVLAVAASMIALVLAGATSAENKPRKLGAAEIRTRISGNDLTDGVHWRRRFQRNGVLDSTDLGEKSTGNWTTRGDQLCFTARKGEPLECYDVFAVSAKQVRLHVEDTGYDLDATIESPGKGRR